MVTSYKLSWVGPPSILKQRACQENYFVDNLIFLFFILGFYGNLFL